MADGGRDGARGRGKASDCRWSYGWTPCNVQRGAVGGGAGASGQHTLRTEMEIESWGRSGSPPETNEACSKSMVCRCIRISILPRGDRGSDVTLIRNSGAKYLFGIAHNQAQRVGKNESKARSEKETVPLASRFYSPLHGSVPAPPHAVSGGPPSPSVPFLIPVAIPTMAERKSAGTSDRIHLSSPRHLRTDRAKFWFPTFHTSRICRTSRGYLCEHHAHTTRINPDLSICLYLWADGCWVTIVANC
jgi:hypothetical protein